MLNSLSYEPEHTKDSLKQKRHYFWKQGQGALVDRGQRRRRKVLSSTTHLRSKQRGDSWSSTERASGLGSEHDSSGR